MGVYSRAIFTEDEIKYFTGCLAPFFQEENRVNELLVLLRRTIPQNADPEHVRIDLVDLSTMGKPFTQRILPEKCVVIEAIPGA